MIMNDGPQTTARVDTCSRSMCNYTDKSSRRVIFISVKTEHSPTVGDTTPLTSSRLCIAQASQPHLRIRGRVSAQPDTQNRSIDEIERIRRG
jgi:hypothetical protein